MAQEGFIYREAVPVVNKLAKPSQEMTSRIEAASLCVRIRQSMWRSSDVPCCERTAKYFYQ